MVDATDPTGTGFDSTEMLLSRSDRPLSDSPMAFSSNSEEGGGGDGGGAEVEGGGEGADGEDGGGDGTSGRIRLELRPEDAGCVYTAVVRGTVGVGTFTEDVTRIVWLGHDCTYGDAGEGSAPAAAAAADGVDVGSREVLTGTEWYREYARCLLNPRIIESKVYQSFVEFCRFVKHVKSTRDHRQTS